MNERLKKLCEQAFSQVWESRKGPDGLVRTDGDPYVFYEIFAQLIVQKCLDQCYNRGMNDELYAGQLKAAAYIEEYFGVEE